MTSRDLTDTSRDQGGAAASRGAVEGGRDPLTLKDWVGFGLLVGCIYALTGSRWQFGYEGSNLAQARALLDGTAARDGAGVLLPYTQGGLLDVLAYIPAIWVERLGLPGGLGPLALAMVMPVQGILLALATLWLGWEVWRSRSGALWVGLGTALATLVWPHSKWGMEVSQAVLTVGGAAALARLVQSGWVCRRGWLILAGCAGLLGLTKVTGIVHGAALVGCAGLYLFRDWRRGRVRLPGAVWWGLAAGVLVAGIGATLAANQWRYGGWIVGGRYAASHAGSLWNVPGGLAGLLFSPNKSLFLFNPPLILAVVGLVLGSGFWRGAWPAALAVGGCVGVHLMVDPWADETYGPRRFLWLVPLLMVGLPGLALRPGWKVLAVTVVGVGLGAQLLAVSFNFTNLPFAVGRSPSYSTRGMIWNPDFQPQRFQIHLWKSWWNRFRGGESLPYEVQQEYFAWIPNGKNLIEQRAAALRAEGLSDLEVERRKIEGNGARVKETFAVAGYDVLDSWVVQRAPGVEGLALGRGLMAGLLLLGAGLGGWMLRSRKGTGAAP